MKFNWINKGMNKVLNKRIGTGLPADTRMGIVHIRGNYFIEHTVSMSRGRENRKGPYAHRKM